MTEEEWEQSPSVGQVLETVKRFAKSVHRGWQRKYRLFACYALRQIQPLTSDLRFAWALDIAERHFDGVATLAELKAAVAEAQVGYDLLRNDLETPEELAAQCLESLVADHPYSCAYKIGGLVAWFRTSRSLTVRNSVTLNDAEKNSAYLVRLIREIFGNPFRPVTFDPAWRTSAAVTLASQMYESRDFANMPILADALEDAGCDNDEVVKHCRDLQQVHVRGCWVVDLVLGKA